MSIDFAFAMIRICFYLAMTLIGTSTIALALLIIRGEAKHRIHRHRRVLQVRDRELAELDRYLARSAEEEKAWKEMVEKNPTIESQLSEVYAAYKKTLDNQKTYIASPEDTIIDGAL